MKLIVVILMVLGALLLNCFAPYPVIALDEANLYGEGILDSHNSNTDSYSELVVPNNEPPNTPGPGHDAIQNPVPA